MESNIESFKAGDYIIYRNGTTYQIGRIKRLTERGAFVCYHEGDTASLTPFSCINRLLNGYLIKDTLLGGDTFRKGVTYEEQNN